MKYIQKRFKDQNPPEPPQLTAWKVQENEVLEGFYQNDNAKAAWGHLQDKLPNVQEEGIVYFTKNELLNAHLLPEQGFICAYCNRIVHFEPAHFNPTLDSKDRRCSVEHVDEKSKNARVNTYNYQNLVATCRGGEKIPPPRYTHCDCKRSDTPLFLHSLMPECEKEFLYISNGEITGMTDRANETIVTLGLDILKLKNDRETEIKKRIFDFDTEGNVIRISDEIAQKQYDLLSQKNEEGKYIEYCGAVLSVLKNEFNVKTGQ
jgi:uncharacterized protein (TIGR02646 family)